MAVHGGLWERMIEVANMSKAQRKPLSHFGAMISQTGPAFFVDMGNRFYLRLLLLLEDMARYMHRPAMTSLDRVSNDAKFVELAGDIIEAMLQCSVDL